MLELLDGTKVWLNSDSELRFPVTFVGDRRNVEIEGEAYFEVAKDEGKPFHVLAKGADIKVLGTTFDVKAYPEEEAIFVALETGSIELKSRSFKSYQLRPGEKAVYNKASGRCEVLRSHDVKMYSAWRRNVLVFKSAPLSDVMKTLARTYDISFDVKDSAALRYTYTITTDSVNLTTVLKELEKITPVLFEEKGGKIEVRMKK